MRKNIDLAVESQKVVDRSEHGCEDVSHKYLSIIWHQKCSHWTSQHQHLNLGQGHATQEGCQLDHGGVHARTDCSHGDKFERRAIPFLQDFLKTALCNNHE